MSIFVYRFQDDSNGLNIQYVFRNE